MKRVKKILSVCLALVLCLVCVPGSSATSVLGNNAFYTDVPADQWGYSSIRALFDLGILPKQETFRPGEPCTRLEFLQTLYRMHLSLGGQKNARADSPFTDIRPENSGFDAVMWALESGITSGVTETEFRPSATLTREQCAVFLLHAAHSDHISLYKTADMTLFLDAASISDYARSSVVSCQMAGIISGYNTGKFVPRGAISRRESAVMIHRLYEAAAHPAGGTDSVSTDPDAYLSVFEEALFFQNVPNTLWSYPCIRALYDMGMFPDTAAFSPKAPITRLDFIKLLYQLHLRLGGAENQRKDSPFTDVPAGSNGHNAVMWAVESGVTVGSSATTFDPKSTLTREQCAVFLLRTAKSDRISLVKTADAVLFQDAARIAKYARSSVTSCQMAGLISGYGNNTFAPKGTTSCQEAASLIYQLWEAASNRGSQSGELVSTEEDAYLSLYDGLKYEFGEPVPASDPVSADWFKNAAFIGDSVTVRLQMYNSSTKALSSATFLCSTSLSATNALVPVSGGSLHPVYNGSKLRLEDSVKACGAKNVFIMLGINNMRMALDDSTGDMVKMIQAIQQKNPGVNIIIQSVTPMTSTSSITAPDINNPKIEQYNAKMRQLCAKYKWYYLDVASVMKDGSGALRPEYCSDTYGMGIHFTSASSQMWVDYLKTHVPDDLR